MNERNFPIVDLPRVGTKDPTKDRAMAGCNHKESVAIANRDRPLIWVDRSRFGSSNERGVALMMVVVVLTALMIVGTPFVISMKLQERGSFRTIGERKADLAQISARNQAVAELFQSHPSREVGNDSVEIDFGDDARGSDFGTRTFPRRTVDDLEELMVDLSSSLAYMSSGGVVSGGESASGGQSPDVATSFDTRNPQGRVVDVRIEDEQGKVNVNSASPMLLANLIGSGHLSADLNANDNDGELPLLDTGGFEADDDDESIDGVVVIFDPRTFLMEAVSYRGKTDKALTGCSRGDYFSGVYSFKRGMPVLDIRALKIFLHRSYDLADGRLRTYRTPASIREIADISMAQLFLDRLSRLGMSAKDLRRYGIGKKDLEELGLGSLYEAFESRDAERRGNDDSFDAKAGSMFGSTGGEDSVAKLAKSYFKRSARSYEVLRDEPGVETFDAVSLRSVQPHVTTFSNRPVLWSEEQLHPDSLTAGSSDPPILIVKHQDFFGPGSLVKIRSKANPNQLEYNFVSLSRQRRRNSGAVGSRVPLAAPLRHDYPDFDALVSVAMPHFININTAAFEVLTACFVGVRLRGSIPGDDWVTRAEATALAKAIIANRPIVDFDHFRAFVEDQESKGGDLDSQLDDDDVAPILLNAINPNHPLLGLSTTGFCFSSENTYTVESTGVVHSDAGFEVARSRAREVIEAFPPAGPEHDTLFVEIASQDEWHYRSFIRQVTRLTNPGRPGYDVHDQVSNATLLPGREGNLMQTGPEVLTEGWGQKRPHLTQGTLQAFPQESAANLVQHNGQPEVTFGEIEHFPLTLEGQDLRGGEAYTRSTVAAASSQGSDDPTDAALERDIVTQPGMVEFWVRPSWGNRNGDRTFFDTMLDPSQPLKNRITLFFDSATSELVFRVSDDTSLPPSLFGNSGSEPVVEVRHGITPATFSDDTWYHITAAWGSSTPGDQALLIDRRPVGQNIWTTRLSAAFGARSYRLTVEDSEVAARFPREGTLMVGQEVVEYEGREGNTFIIREADAFRRLADGRGARGTPRIDHPIQTPIRLFGYSTDILASDSLVSTVRRETFEVDPDVTPEELAALRLQGLFKLVPLGGARTDGDFKAAKWITDYNTDETRLANFPAMFVSNTTAPGLESSPGPLPPGAISVDVIGTPALHPAELGFPESGYLQVITYRNGDRNIEYVKYSQITAGAVLGNNRRKYSFTGIGRGMMGTDRAPAGNGVSIVYGCSIRTDSNRLDELYPSSGVIQLANTGYLNAGGAADGILPAEAEWLYYRRIAEKRFFIADPSRQFAFRGFGGGYDYAGSGEFNASFRGTLTGDNSTNLDHRSGKLIFPVIRVDQPVVGRDDYVFVSESEGEVGTRVAESVANRVHIVRYSDSGTYVSFRELFQNEYLVRTNPKLKMFPSGELPIASSGEMSFGNSAGASPGGPGDFVIDEIRFSRARRPGVEYTMFPAQGRSRVILDQAPEPIPTVDPRSVPQVDRKVIRRYVRESDDSGTFDRLLVYPRGRLRIKEDQGVAFRYRESRDPDSFGLGKNEGLALAGSESIHYRFSPNQTADDGIVALAETIAPDLVVQYTQPDANGDYPPFNPSRDLRAEVWPRIAIRRVSGTLPSTNTFLEVFFGSQREIIFYERANNDALINVLRGQLGTPISGHIVFGGFTGQQINTILLRVVPYREVEILRREMLGTQAEPITDFATMPTLPLPQIGVTRIVGQVRDEIVQVEGVEDLPDAHGYVITDQGRSTGAYEVLGYLRTERNAEGSFLVRAQDDFTRAGLFRGRFGTHTEQALAAGTTLVEFPVRYHDRYQPDAETADLQYYQRAFRVSGAFWDSIQWEEVEVRNRSLNTQVRVVARFDGSPEWNSRPTNEPGGLYLFTDGEADNLVGIESETVEFRVYFHHPQGSYGRNASEVGGGWSDSWKHAPVLNRLRLNYRKSWRVLHREELPH